MITNKLHDVPDHLCTHCSQLWKGECRAYQKPQSIDERLNRRNSRPLCETEGKVRKSRKVLREMSKSGAEMFAECLPGGQKKEG